MSKLAALVALTLGALACGPAEVAQREVETLVFVAVEGLSQARLDVEPGVFSDYERREPLEYSFAGVNSALASLFVASNVSTHGVAGWTAASRRADWIPHPRDASDHRPVELRWVQQSNPLQRKL